MSKKRHSETTMSVESNQFQGHDAEGHGCRQKTAAGNLQQHLQVSCDETPEEK